MRKHSKRQPRNRGHILLPEQVQKMVMPLHMALELLPLGLFSREHADHLAKMINIVFVDATGKSERAMHYATRAGDVLTAMWTRHKQGKSWGTTSEERKELFQCIVEIDQYLRRMTTDRLKIAAVTIDELNAEAKAKGYKFLDKAPVVDGRNG